ncbi:YbaN family protein, partial [Aerococcaceae bacterium NML191292]|nr:YbaN family protein [Aerococcaceae bacterium NML191292]
MYRLFFLTGGFISLSIGIVGIILPVIPTTPLLLLS